MAAQVVRPQCMIFAINNRIFYNVGSYLEIPQHDPNTSYLPVINRIKLNQLYFYEGWLPPKLSLEFYYAVCRCGFSCFQWCFWCYELYLTCSRWCSPKRRCCFVGSVWCYHRERTVLLSRESVNKQTKRINSLRLSPHLISSILRDFTGKTTAYKSCVTL